MTESTLCYLFSTIAQILATTVGISGAALVFLMQKIQAAVDGHSKMLYVLPVRPHARLDIPTSMYTGRGNLGETVTRIMSMGMEEAVVAGALQAVCAVYQAGSVQRLVRKLFLLSAGSGAIVIVASLFGLCFAADLAAMPRRQSLAIGLSSAGLECLCLLATGVLIYKSVFSLTTREAKRAVDDALKSIGTHS
jgi:hypothetical protein